MSFSNGGQAPPPVRPVHWILLPFAILGAIANYPTYRLIGALTNRLSRENELRATMKFVGALTLYPLTWIVIATLIGLRFGIIAALLSLAAAPILGYVALRVFESLARWRDRPRNDFAAKRAAIREEILAVGEEMARHGAR